MRAAIPGERLRQLLAAAGMTQAELARRLQLDPGQVSRWCRGRAPLHGDYAATVVELMRGRGVEVDVMDLSNRVFFSTPMTALTDGYVADRAAAAQVYEQLCKVAAPVYWPADHIDSAEMFEAPDLATERNLVALLEAEAFVFLQLRELIHPTSCHIELGMAIARSTPATVFAPSEECLPYTLRRFEAISGRAGFGGRYRFYAIKSADDAVRLLAIHGLQLLGLAPRPAVRPLELSK